MPRSYQGKPEEEYSWYKPSLSLRDISPEGRDRFGLCVRGSEPALSVAARHLSQRERRVWTVREGKIS